MSKKETLLILYYFLVSIWFSAVEKLHWNNIETSNIDKSNEDVCSTEETIVQRSQQLEKKK